MFFIFLIASAVIQVSLQYNPGCSNAVCTIVLGFSGQVHNILSTNLPNLLFHSFQDAIAAHSFSNDLVSATAFNHNSYILVPTFSIVLGIT
jgi:hypothetical protein